MFEPQKPSTSPADGRSQCPECGASVPIVAERWLHVHREGTAEYAYPRGDAPRRCPGSLLPVRQPSSDPAETP